MNTIGVVGDVDEISIKIDAMLGWSGHQLRKFLQSHDSLCDCDISAQCAIYRAANEEAFFRRNPSDLPSGDMSLHRDVTRPCAADPCGWDTDVASTGQLLVAIDACNACPFRQTCSDDAKRLPTQSMVWAGIPYDRDGDPIRLSALSEWVRSRDGSQESNTITMLPAPRCTRPTIRRAS